MSSEKSNFVSGGVIALAGCVVGFAFTIATLVVALDNPMTGGAQAAGDTVAASEKSPAERYAEDAGLPFAENEFAPFEELATSLVDIQPALSNISMTEKEAVYSIDGVAATEVYLVDLATRHSTAFGRDVNEIYSIECTVDGSNAEARLTRRDVGPRAKIRETGANNEEAMRVLSKRYCQTALDTGIFDTFKEAAKAAS